MDKNSLTGLVMMGLVIFGFFWFNQPSPKELEARRAQQEAAQQAVSSTPAQQQAQSLSIVPTGSEEALAALVKTHGIAVEGQPGIYRLSNPSAQLTVDTRMDSAPELSGFIKVGKDSVDVNKILANDLLDYTPEQADRARAALNSVMTTFGKYKSFAPFYYGTNETIVLENEQMRVTFASKGGMVQEVILKKYLNENTEPASDVTLFTAKTGSYNLAFVTADQRIYTDSLYFRTEEVTDSSLVMSLPMANGNYWRIRYTLVPEYYIVRMEVEQKGMEAIIPPSCTTIAMDWRQKMGRNEKGRTFEEQKSFLCYKHVGERPDELESGSDDSEKINGRVKWVAFKNQFFSSVIIPREYFTSCDLNSVVLKKNPDFLKNMRMESVMPYSSADGSPIAFDFFFGPNDYPLLNSLDKQISTDGEGLNLNYLVPLGWWWCSWINKIITIPLFTFLHKFISNYGIIILLLTIFIKLILFPLTYKSYISQAKMRVLAPEVKAINDKYPGQENAMKRQQETMALYSRAGASPMSGCLPMLVQMPVLIALFWFFPSAIELRGQSFLWAHDLSAPDSILTLPFTIPFYGNHVSLFCLLMTVTNIIYTRITMQSQPTGNSMPGMKWMMYLMPVMFMFWFNDYASGLSYYYFLSLLITILQTWACRKFFVDEDKVRKQMLENAKKPKKKSGWMVRLEEAQRRQEAILREQQKRKK